MDPARRRTQVLRVILQAVLAALALFILPFLVGELNARPPGVLRRLTSQPLLWALIVLCVVVLVQLFLERGRSTSDNASAGGDVDVDMADLSLRVQHYFEDHLRDLVAIVAELPVVLRLRPDLLMEASPRRQCSTSMTEASEPPELGQLFDDSDRSLLLVGAPGVGKTVALAKLTKNLMERHDELRRVPAIFYLREWHPDSASLEDWLVEGVRQTYRIAPDAARVLIMGRRVIPILVGLDDVLSEHRDACVRAINEFQHKLGVPIAVSCRTNIYEEFTERLDVGLIAEVLPPDRADVARLLTRLDTPVAAAAAAAPITDYDWWYLACSRRVLTMIAQISARAPATELRHTGSIMERRRYLVGQYVHTMLNPANGHLRYARAETGRWLSWLASTMRRHNTVEVMPDRLDFRWLVGEGEALPAEMGGPVLSFMGICELLPLIAVCAAWTAVKAPVRVLTGFTMSSLTAAAMTSQALFAQLPLRSASSVHAGQIHPIEDTYERWPELLGWVIVPPVLLLLLYRVSGALMPVPLLVAVIVYPLIGVTILPTPKRAGLHRVAPKPMIELRESARFAKRRAAVVGVLYAIAIPVAVDGAHYPPFAVVATLAAILQITPMVWCRYGGMPIIQYRTYCRMLAKRNLGPRQYERFLNYAADQVLLREIGMGYQFIHPELLEYFADHWDNHDSAEHQPARAGKDLA